MTALGKARRLAVVVVVWLAAWPVVIGPMDDPGRFLIWDLPESARWWLTSAPSAGLGVLGGVLAALVALARACWVFDQ